MYTELSGRASFLVTVPRSRKAAVKSVLFQPLSFIELEADYRPNATLYRVKEAKSFYPFLPIPYDPYKSSMALFSVGVSLQGYPGGGGEPSVICLSATFHHLAG